MFPTRRVRTAAATALASLLVSLLGVTDLPAAAAPGPAPVRILLLGDSVTQGSDGDWTWRYRLWKHLQSSSTTAIDLVGPNDGVRSLVTQGQDGQEYADPDFDRDHAARWGMPLFWMDHPIADLVEVYRPDVVVEVLGLNDLLLHRTPAEVTVDLARLVGDARSADPGVDVVIAALPQTWFTGVPEFNAGLPALAASLDQSGSRVSATAAPAFDIETDTWDTSHPSATGEVKIAAAVADALAELGIGTPYPRPLPVVPNGPVRVAALSGTATPGAVALTWTNPPGQTGEHLWSRDVTAAQAWTRDPTPSAQADTSRTVGGLVAGHRYEFRLQASKGTAVATDRYSNTVAITLPAAPGVDAPAPATPGSTAVVSAAPRTLRATLLAGPRARLTWSRSRLATSYVVQQRRASRWQTIARTSTRRFVTPRLAAGRLHRFRVVAHTGDVRGGTSPIVRVRPRAR